MKNSIFKIENIIKKFPDGSVVLDSVSLEIFENECLVITGANGSGKTLLRRIMTGLINATSGKVFYKGFDLKKSIKTLRRSVGFVFQDAEAQIIGETAEEDILFGLENFGFSKTEREERLYKVIKDFFLEKIISVPARKLSGGEKRRLAAAGIAATGCETVIMDEPFANLDWPGTLNVFNLIKTLKINNKTVIILTHELEKVLSFAQRIVVLVKGKIMDDGSPLDVIKRLDPSWGVRDPLKSYLEIKESIQL